VVDWHYEPAEDLDQTLIERLRRFPREPDMLVFGARMVTAAVIRTWLRIYHRLEIVGRENIPDEGSFVIVANHSSHLDVLCLLAALPIANLHRAFPAAAQDYFFTSVPRTLLAAVVANALPFNRQTNPRQSINLCRELLGNPGNILVLFPEGTRSVTGEMAEFKPGLGLFLAGTPHPVVPCYLDGAYRAWPKGAWLPRPTRVRLVIGQPHSYAELKAGKAAAIEISRDLQERVQALRDATTRRSEGSQLPIAPNDPAK
jgi:1-acyl-sn-glycerol-3-phosphate acyltransferase